MCLGCLPLFSDAKVQGSFLGESCRVVLHTSPVACGWGLATLRFFRCSIYVPRAVLCIRITFHQDLYGHHYFKLTYAMRSLLIVIPFEEFDHLIGSKVSQTPTVGGHTTNTAIFASEFNQDRLYRPRKHLLSSPNLLPSSGQIIHLSSEKSNKDV